MIHHISVEALQRCYRALDNKVVLAFEAKLSAKEACKWINTFNQKSNLHLTLFEELPNALFVIQFKAADLGEAKRSLIEASPLSAGKLYVLVNF